MVFGLDHWRKPRATIACKFFDNDIAYATHGAQVAAEAYNLFDLRPSEARQKTILDYGCGTARSSRVLSYLFGFVYGYDPVQECVNTGIHECNGLTFQNMVLTADFTKVPTVDLSVSINVIEHLTDEDAQIMITNLRSKSRACALWYSASKNAAVLAPYLTEQQKQEDAANPGIQVRLFRW